MSRADRICARCGIPYAAGSYRSHARLDGHKTVLRFRQEERHGNTKRALTYVQMKELYDLGYSYQAIADAAGITRQRVGQIFRRAGIARGIRAGKTCFVCGETYTKWLSHVDNDTHQSDVAHLVVQLRSRT